MPAGKEHWEKIYSGRKPDEVSWFQDEPALSLRLIAASGIGLSEGIIDVGGGASRLAGRLLALGYSDLSVLDISGHALAYARERLGADAARLHWIEGDATEFEPTRSYSLWHDRAVFHFLTDAEDRARYLKGLKLGLRQGGRFIVAAFAEDGPEKCSGLPVRRYGKNLMQDVLGADFELTQMLAETHRTPWDTEQKFNYFSFKKSR